MLRSNMRQMREDDLAGGCCLVDRIVVQNHSSIISQGCGAHVESVSLSLGKLNPRIYLFKQVMAGVKEENRCVCPRS